MCGQCVVDSKTSSYLSLGFNRTGISKDFQFFLLGNYSWLVVWNMTFVFPFIGNFIIITDELIFFRGAETTNQIVKLRVLM